MTTWTATQIPAQQGRTAVVTGANSGLGLVTATELARHGARVVLAVRDTTAGERAAAGIRQAVPGAELEVRELDLASLASVRAFAKGLDADIPALDLLINNAGLVLLGPARTTSDGFELHLGTNMLGHFALTGLLLDALHRAATAHGDTPPGAAATAGDAPHRAAAGKGSTPQPTTGGSNPQYVAAAGGVPRVVSLSSIMHKGARLDPDDLMSRRDYTANRAYGRSKLATTVFGLELDRRLRAAGSPIRSVLAHPGLTRTNLTPRAWQHRGRLGQVFARAGLLLTQPVEQGTLPQLYAATAPDVRGGQFFGPSGPGETRGRVVEVRPSKRAADPAAGRHLWAAAQNLTGVTYL